MILEVYRKKGDKKPYITVGGNFSFFVSYDSNGAGHCKIILSDETPIDITCAHVDNTANDSKVFIWEQWES